MSGQQPPFEMPPSPCPADHVQSVEPGSPSGAPSHGREPVGCLILKVPRLSSQMQESVMRVMEPLAVSMNLKVMVIDSTCDAEIRYAQDPLLKALAVQTDAINRLAQSNEMLVQAMAEDAGVDEDRPVSQYLDGSPVR